MADLEAIKQSARIVNDEQGTPVVQIPLEQWRELLEELEQEAKPSQLQQMQALIQQWQHEPDDTSPQWWDDFDAFLRENPVFARNRDAILVTDNDKDFAGLSVTVENWKQ